MITVNKLTKSFGHMFALRGVDLQISKGTCLAIFGPNGAGKSTFIRILATLSKPSSGSIEIEGKSIFSDAHSFRKRLGVIAHTTFLYDELTARENLNFYAKLYNVQNARDKMSSLLEDVGLAARAGDRVRTFSRGMQQRLSIARAVLHDPDILLLDEPFTGLDQHASELLRHWIERLRSENRTIILVTHDLNHGIHLADSVAILMRGKVAFNDSVDQIDKNHFQKLYFKAVSKGVAR